ncbi:hypothetical protein GGI07_004614 [Coemansia sp. Benny D115]|nr:hypothetical protein GGI07_004614 [Coemansia sp. Benny D115]
MTLSDFLANVRALLPYTIKDGNHRYARFDINDVPIPKENFGFVASNGVLFYRDNTYVTYMSGFIPDVFSVMLQELPNLALLDIKKSNWISRYISPYSKVTVPGTASTVVSANSTTIVSDYNGSKPFKTPSAEWSPGQTVDVEFHGSAAHSGGHSEFSVSYDNGATFAVIHQELKYMFFGTPTQVTNRPKKLKYSIKLPNDLPGADNAVFAWTWVNASGNREFYMNCVDVKIVGEPGEYTGKQMTVVNYGPDMPVIPEFLGNYSTGIEYYTNAPNITVYGDGNAVYNSEVADDSD